MNNIPTLHVTNASTFPSDSEFKNMIRMADYAVKSQMLPFGITKPEQALLIMMKGRELGIPPIQSFSSIHVIKGKTAISSELMLALIYGRFPDAKVEFAVANNEVCHIIAKRPGDREVEVAFSMEDAKRAKLLGKENWQLYPAAMLRARCISAMARMVFPDVLAGASYTPEELESIPKDVTSSVSDNGNGASGAAVQNKEEPPSADKTQPVNNNIQKNTPDWMVYRHFKEINVAKDDMQLVLQKVFNVTSFKHLTDKHIEIFNRILDTGMTVWDEYVSLLEMEIALPISVDDEMPDFESSEPVNTVETPETAIPIYEAGEDLDPGPVTVGADGKVYQATSEDQPKELPPAKPRNMAKRSRFRQFCVSEKLN